jgi:hypothetical protein
MEKLIIQVSYWLGIASGVIALGMRACNSIGLLLPPATARAGETIWYMSFYKGALLFFLIAIATESYSSTRRQQSS